MTEINDTVRCRDCSATDGDLGMIHESWCTRKDQQPTPIKNELPYIHDLVAQDIMGRKALGKQRYGTGLQPFNGRSVERDLYEELLDVIVYLRQRLYEGEHPEQAR